MSNKALTSAKVLKNDEFYTTISEIEQELKNYIIQFKGKSVYCNCDDIMGSNFVRYFLTNFTTLGLKELIISGYSITPISKSVLGESSKAIITDTNGSLSSAQILSFVAAGIKGELSCVKVTPGSGDFRAPDNLELLQRCDIVVTNPPFSLFREYTNIIMSYNKKFLILGSLNAVGFKEIFPYIKDNRMWLGCRPLNKDMYFDIPRDRQQWLVANKSNGSAYKVVNGRVMGRLASACWFTNLDHVKRHQRLKLNKANIYKGHECEYPTYDNFDAISIDRVKDIPCDYYGVMGVPITFLGQYCPEQFELLGHEHDLNGTGYGGSLGQFEVGGVGKYKRILIRRLS